MILYQNKDVVKGYKNSIVYNTDHTEYTAWTEDTGQDTVESNLRKQGIEITENTPEEWESPSLITNAVITITKENGLTEAARFEFLLSVLEKLVCKHIAIHFLHFTPLEKIEQLLKKVALYNIHSVYVICNYDENYFTDEFGEIIMELKTNKKLMVFNSPFEKNFEDTMYFLKGNSLNTTAIRKNSFHPNRYLFNEARVYNAYFNRKLFIGAKGELKNAPECENAYGDLSAISSFEDMITIVQKAGFQKYWKARKDNCDVCKDCEFRYMCIDNRLAKQRNTTEWYYEQECDYNPYVGKWKEDEGYKTLKECGIKVDQDGFSINPVMPEG